MKRAALPRPTQNGYSRAPHGRADAPRGPLDRSTAVASERTYTLRCTLLSAAMTLTVVAWTAAVPARAADRGPRSTMRPFVVRTLDGRTLRSSDLRGRPLILEFWATWSPPSRAGVRGLSALQARHGSRGLIVLGLSVDDDPAPRVLEFARRQRLLFPVAMASEAMLDDYGPIRSLPTMILIDRRGRIARRVVGLIDAETLEGFVREIL
jgi:thiol-disulfide isomerase/thioredoxin